MLLKGEASVTWLELTTEQHSNYGEAKNSGPMCFVSMDDFHCRRLLQANPSLCFHKKAY